jgi:hypothetical protein
VNKILISLLICASLLGAPPRGLADDANEAQAPSAPVPAARAPGAGGIEQVSSEPAGMTDAAKYSADAKWEIAGYNNEEIIYTILVTNQDTRIIHCNAVLKGFYFENGEKHSISDRQGSTIFPGRQVAVGHWMGMDQKSGATYELKCRPV